MEYALAVEGAGPVQGRTVMIRAHAGLPAGRARGIGRLEAALPGQAPIPVRVGDTGNRLSGGI